MDSPELEELDHNAERATFGSALDVARTAAVGLGLFMPSDAPELPGWRLVGWYCASCDQRLRSRNRNGHHAGPADWKVTDCSVRGDDLLPMYVPAENGLFFRVEEAWNDHLHGLSLDLYSRTCRFVQSGNEWLWLPWDVGVVGGRLVPDRSTFWSWAEPEWVVETIDRLARKPFTQPDGPLVQIVRLSHFEEEDADE